MKEVYKRFNIMGEVNDRLVYLNDKKKSLEKMLAHLPEGNLLVAPGKTKNSTVSSTALYMQYSYHLDLHCGRI